ncbi:helix-turn-helix transcriptional regulator [Staphylococcus edaphicus]|uniref:Transcriptional regulator n=1 Tax=Staphylococcus edaphicus TaxID=1955013 RepID=A0A2C6VID8_9STAP|nr:helix-turn-helix transcriptional regulator [Staphylococcus edaphicus]PHK49991.1 transcriptional regulator [Staphylococcus edaphicus]UQW81748.1 helix-turn-helix transcriptional regulator [Staphylococcus edaphicus]
MNHVKLYRTSKQMSQLTLARAVEVSRQTINMIENNKYNPSLNLCINIAKALDVTLNDLFWEEDSYE